jgi:hypothetical protein
LEPANLKICKGVFEVGEGVAWKAAVEICGNRWKSAGTGPVLRGKALAGRRTGTYDVLPSTSEATKATFRITRAAGSLLSDVGQLFYRYSTEEVLV